MNLDPIMPYVRIFTMLAMIIMAFYLGELVAQNYVLQTAYLQGRIYTVDGQRSCLPSLDTNHVPYWNCSFEPNGPSTIGAINYSIANISN